MFLFTPFLPSAVCSSNRALLHSILRNENQRPLGLFRISQVSRVHKDLLLDLFSSSAVQMEKHISKFVPKRTSIVWARPNSLTGIAPYGARTRKNRKSKWAFITSKQVNKSFIS